MIEPRTLKGFRDYLPEAMIPRERLIDTARRVYRSYGFSPIDTPALEYLEILAGKGSEETDKQLYKFQDHGGRWVGLRFDLTVPLARFAAQHISELGMPFKRYHIATVWRGENTQRGRYREFMQCDFDTIGTRSRRRRHRNRAGDPRPAARDRLRRTSRSASTTAWCSNGLLEKLGLADKATAGAAALDKLGKIGPDNVAEEMVAGRRRDARTGRQTCCGLPNLTGANDEILRQLEPLVAGSETGPGRRRSARARCSTASQAAGVAAERVALDVSIARGLDYYTGTVFETFLDALPGDRQRLLRRALRQPGRAVHQAGTAGHRRLAGPGPPAGGDGRAGHDREGRHAGRRVHPLLRRGPAARLSAAGRACACARASASRSFPTPRSSASN